MNDCTLDEALYGYRRVSERQVLQVVKEIRQTMDIMQKHWDAEVAKYEETMVVRTEEDKSRCLLRRNYPNEAGIIEDTSLFPYHNACYALLDRYEAHNDHETATNGISYDSDSSEEDEWWPSVVSINQSLSLLAELDVPERNEILLRLLKHSMADFQTDHILTGELLQRTRDWKCFQDVKFYRNLIACFLLDRVICNGRCEALVASELNADDADQFYDHHNCDRWQRIESIFGEALVTGLEEFTSEHAFMICAFFKITLDMANPSAGEKDDEIVSNIGTTPIKSRKAKLKQAIYLGKMTDYDDEYSDDDSEENNVKEVIPYCVMREFVVALSQFAGKNRHQIWNSKTAFETFCNSVGTLVFMGETSVRRLPAKKDSIEFCSKIVTSFVGAYVHDWDVHENDGPYFISPGLPSVIAPNRYADAIEHSTERFLRGKDMERALLQPDLKLPLSRDRFPRVPIDVFDVIQCFFARDLASVDRAGCGYGDCLVWLRGDITGHDPFLFFSDSHNFPVNEDEEDDEDSPAWVYDEENKPVSPLHISARYDFTLLKLVHSWNSPWKPGRHHSYQPQFRAAVKAIFLCSNRLGMPHDIACYISQFLPRSFWPDERARCWCDDCSVDNAISLMIWKLNGKLEDRKPKLQVSKLCECRVAMYRNNEHRRKDSGQHRKWCQSIPLCIPGREEERFCQLIESKLAGELVADETADAVAMDDEGDDEGSWESIASDEEETNEPKSVTEMIHDFFSRRSYRHHSTEETAFEAMYNER